jgi:threonine dehydrogenase-like Zn-dependent dehydrogenase
MAMMRAAMKTGSKAIEIIRVPRPEPKSGEYLVRTTACAICASDFSGWVDGTKRDPTPGQWNAWNPGMTGHEMVGRIEAAGPGADPARVGQRVWGDYFIGCGECVYCHSGREAYCSGRRIISQGYSDYFTCPDSHLYRIDDNLTDAEASLLWDMVGTPLHGMKRVQVTKGDTVAVWGLGPVGLGMVQGARIYGASRIVGVDPIPMRREIAKRLGAEATVDPLAQNPVDAVRALFPPVGPDIAAVGVGDERVFQQAYESLRIEGRMVTAAGSPKLGGQTPKWVTGTFVCFSYEFPEFLGYVRSGAFDLKHLVTHQFPLERINEAFQVRVENQAASLKVVVTME